MTQGYLLIDANNIGFAACSLKKLTVGDQEVQAIFGVVRAVRMMTAAYPMLKPIILHDGNSWRKTAFADYKEGRESNKYKSDEKKLAIRASYKTQKPFIRKALAQLGVTQISAFNYEADDLAGLLVHKHQPRGSKILMITADRDWLQLVRPGVGWRDPIRHKKVTLNTLEDHVGVKAPAQYLEVKALMGDMGDSVPGVGGIGEKGAVELINTYGSVASFLNGYIDGTLDGKIPKKFMDFAMSDEKQSIFARNLKLMDLSPQHIPSPINLKVEKTSLDRKSFQDFCNDFAFKSILRDFDDWVEPFERLAA